MNISIVRPFVLIPLFAISLMGCRMNVSITDTEALIQPTVSTVDPKIKISSGAVEATSSSIKMKATIGPTDQDLTGASVRARVSMSQIHQ